jgi:tetratricopeptide (TPR) repeat protein
MLTTWLTLRQAEDALKHGRLDDACRLLQQPEAMGHKKASELLQQIGLAYLSRAELHLQHNDTPAAWDDLLRAEQAGLHSKPALKIRQELQQRSLKEVQQLLTANEPRRALELAERLKERGVQTPEQVMLEEVARSWSLALELMARGEFGQALSTLEKAARNSCPQLDEFRLELKHKHREFESLIAQLHRGLEKGHWREVIHIADQVLTLAPQHPEARKARAKAWRAVEPPTATIGAAPTSKPVEQAVVEELPRRLLLWIDGVGGYLVCLAPRVSIGQATPDAYVDVPLFADISRLHGYLTRDAEGYLLEAVRPLHVNQKAADKVILNDGDRITLGASCQLRFHKPVEISGTARLETLSGHRLPVSVDGVILMADTCILGPAGQAHIVVPDLERPVVIFRRKEGLGVQGVGEFTVDGKKIRDRATLTTQSTVTGENFRLSIEAVGNNIGRVRV